MKRFLSLIAAGLLTCTATSIHAQSRDLGANRLIIDNGTLGRLTASYIGVGDGVFYFTANSMTVPIGTGAGQTLYWNGTQWAAANNLGNNGTTVNITGPMTLGGLAGTSGQVLTSNGVGLAPTWQNAAAGGVTSLSSGSADLTVSAPTGAVVLNLANPLVRNLTGNASTATLATTATTANALANTAPAGASVIAALSTNGGSITNNTSGNAATATLATTATTATTANALANTAPAGASVIAALSTNGGSITNNTSGTSANVTGVVVEANGGTGFSTYAAGDLLYASAANDLSKRSIGAAGNVLTVVGGMPVWQAPATGITSVTGDANVSANTVAGAVTLGLNNPINVNTSGNAATATLATTATTANALANTAPAGASVIAALSTNGGAITNNTSGNAATATLATTATTANALANTAPAGASVIAALSTNGGAITNNTSGNAATATLATTATTANALANTAPAGASVIAALSTNGGSITNNTSGTSANVTGVVVEANGGTGFSTYAAGDLLYASAANDLSKRSIGAAGNVLTVVGGMPVWQAPVASGITSVTGDANVSANTVAGAVTLGLNNPINVNTSGNAATATLATTATTANALANTAPAGASVIAALTTNGGSITNNTSGNAATATLAATATTANALANTAPAGASVIAALSTNGGSITNNTSGNAATATLATTATTATTADALANTAPAGASVIAALSTNGGSITNNTSGNAATATLATTATTATTADALANTAPAGASVIAALSTNGGSITNNTSGNAATATLATTATTANALANSDPAGQSAITAINAATTGTIGAARLPNLENLNGTLDVASGGTGRTSVTANALLVGNGTGAMNEIAPGTNTHVLTMVAGSPTWAVAPGGGGGVTSLTGTANEVEVSAATGAVTVGLPATGVTAGAYLNANVTVDVNGRVTSISNGGNGSQFIETFAMTSPWATTSNTLVPVTDMDFAIGANEIWTFEFNMGTASTNVAGMHFGIGGPAGASLMAIVTGTGSNFTDYVGEGLYAFNTANTTDMTKSASNAGICRITGLVQASGTAGTVSLRVEKKTSGTATIATGSYMIARRLQ